MKKVEVRLKPEIARKGGCFCDIAGRQDIIPPRDKKGTPSVDHVFTLIATPFVEEKIASGELILLKREAEEKAMIPVFVGKEKASEVAVPAGATEEEISQLVLMDKAVSDACGNGEIKKFSVKKNRVVIEVK